MLTPSDYLLLLVRSTERADRVEAKWHCTKATVGVGHDPLVTNRCR
jgi:hypothetical protein